MPTTDDPRAASRDRLALALDVDDPVAAQRLATELRPWFGVVKVGLELFSASGPSIVALMIDDGYRVFLDLKLADIPTTVERTARVLGALGVSFLTMHTFSGEAMLSAGVAGLAAGADRAGLPAPGVLGVTALTSDGAIAEDVLAARVKAASAAGCAGVVCAATDVAATKRIAPDLLIVVPGIRLPGHDRHDQRRAATPAEAIAAGADLLVIGRAVTGRADRRAAAQGVANAVA